MPGQDVTVTASGFGARELVEVTVHSTPRLLGAATASSGGIVAYPFTVPADLPAGGHTLVLRGGARTALFAFHLAKAGSATATQSTPTATSGAPAASHSPLPFTGSNTVRLLVIALLLLWAGTMLVLYVGPPTTRDGRHTPTGRHRH